MGETIRRAISRADIAESGLRSLAAETQRGISMLAARSAIVEAAMRVLIKHDLLTEFSHELNHPPVTNGEL